jgi:hypothetical protein
VELEPGVHRVAVKYSRPEGFSPMAQSIYVAESLNHQTVSYQFEAGKEYTLLVETTSGPITAPRVGEAMGLWKALLAEKETNRIVAQPDTSPAPGAPAEVASASTSGATVVGVAKFDTPAGALNAAGREVLLVPKSKAQEWVRKKGKQLNGEAFLTLYMAPPGWLTKTPYRAIGYGEGSYQIANVPPGEYLAVMLFSTGYGEHLAAAEVTVTPGQARAQASPMRLVGLMRYKN